MSIPVSDEMLLDANNTVCGDDDKLYENAEELEKPRSRRTEKRMELGDFIADNKLRLNIGMKKVKEINKPVLSYKPHSGEGIHQSLPNKGIRKEKKPSARKKKILKAREQNVPTCSNNSDASFSASPLDESVIDLLRRIRKQANVAHKANSTKARSKRTFVCGLHECLKHVKADNVKCIILARNMDPEVATADPLFHHLCEECMSRDIPLVHASTKRLLSRAMEKFPYTNFVGLFFFDGFEDIYRSVIQFWKASDSYKLYHIDQKSLFA